MCSAPQRRKRKHRPRQNHKAHKPVATAEAAPPISKPRQAKPPLDKSALDMLTKAVIASADEDGRANLGRVGGHLAKQAPDFDARNYGFARLSELVAASGLVDMDISGDRPKIITVKLKAAPATKRKDLT